MSPAAVVVRGLVLALALALPGSALALSFAPQIMVDVAGVGGGPVAINSSGTRTDFPDLSVWTLDAPISIDSTIQINSWTALLDEDPYVTNNINVTNLTNAPQTFIATVILPIPAFNYDQVIASSVGITATDSNGNNILSVATNGGTPIYQGQVNGSTILSLTPPLVPLTTADCGTPGAGCSATDSLSIGSQLVTPGVAASIAIVLTFDLSPFDSAGFTSRFEIVPEPGTGLLVGLGLALVATLRRRSLH